MMDELGDICPYERYILPESVFSAVSSFSQRLEIFKEKYPILSKEGIFRNNNGHRWGCSARGNWVIITNDKTRDHILTIYRGCCTTTENGYELVREYAKVTRN